MTKNVLRKEISKNARLAILLLVVAIAGIVGIVAINHMRDAWYQDPTEPITTIINTSGPEPMSVTELPCDLAPAGQPCEFDTLTSYMLPSFYDVEQANATTGGGAGGDGAPPGGGGDSNGGGGNPTATPTTNPGGGSGDPNVCPGGANCLCYPGNSGYVKADGCTYNCSSDGLSETQVSCPSTCTPSNELTGTCSKTVNVNGEVCTVSGCSERTQVECTANGPNTTVTCTDWGCGQPHNCIGGAVQDLNINDSRSVLGESDVLGTVDNPDRYFVATAYGRIWTFKWQNNTVGWVQSPARAENRLAEIKRYQDGPCKGKSGDACEFDTMIIYKNPNGKTYEVVTAYGKIWSWEIVNGKGEIYAPLYNKLLHNQTIYGEACDYIGKNDETCKFDTHTITVKADGTIFESVTVGDRYFLWRNGGNIPLQSGTPLITIPRFASACNNVSDCQFEARGAYTYSDGSVWDVVIMDGKQYVWKGPNDDNFEPWQASPFDLSDERFEGIYFTPTSGGNNTGDDNDPTGGDRTDGDTAANNNGGSNNGGGNGNRNNNARFPDVPTTNVFHSFVEELASDGTIGGFGDGTFKPDQNVTRAQLAKFVTNGFGLESQPTDCGDFSDVPADNVFYEFIMPLKCSGVIGGYPDGTFRPDEDVTRGAAMKFVVQAVRVAKDDPNALPVTEGVVFNDVPNGHTFFRDVMAAYSADIVGGYSDGVTFGVDDSLTRGQIAKIISGARDEL